MSSAPTYAAPRWPHRVSPEPRNSRLLTTLVCTPAASSRANAVGLGCHSSGSTGWSQNSELSSAPVSGTREVKPTRPCWPGREGGAERGQRGGRRRGHAAGRRAVAAPSSEWRYGACARCSASRSWPSPSTSITTYAGAGGSDSERLVEPDGDTQRAPPRRAGRHRASGRRSRARRNRVRPACRSPLSSGCGTRATRRTRAARRRRPARRRRS